MSCIGVRVMGGLRDKIKRVMGSGNEKSYWRDSWVDGKPLCVKFNRLFRISEQMVGEMGVWGEEGWSWELRRNKNL